MRLPWARTADEPAPLDHEELIGRIAQGDEEAFGALYDDLSARVFGLIRRILRDESQSEEVLQEVFVEIWQHAARYDADRGRCTSWIMVMAHRRAVDRVRASQSSKDRDLREGVKGFEESYDNVQETVEARMESERVQEALKCLSVAQRQAIELAYFGGYTHQEVAGMLEAPVGTVKTRIRDGMIKLRDQLGVA
ncbi:ECF RNA polymerase sigma factor SigK [Arthrobacter rhombi]|nr:MULTISPECIES: ECF RNA polymerase sigma factor SigK [Micrococcaceae]PCC24794.1 RNA polymerase subunit sigma [Glutamicibacter sp. BW78]